MTKPTTAPGTLSIHVTFRIAKRGGRRQVQMPPDTPVQRSRIDNTLVKALGRAFRWQRMLEDGTHATLLDLAGAEKINPSYVSRVLRLTLLAPEIVDAILAGRQETALTMHILSKPFPERWSEQSTAFLDCE